MKALKILIILSVFLVFLPDLEAICCESSCSDFANICEGTESCITGLEVGL